MVALSLRFVILSLLSLIILETTAYGGRLKAEHKNAYATMMYMGTPRDYEFYVATRVLIRSLVKLHVDADLVVIASIDVPHSWVRALENEDGARVVRVENLNNPYKNQANMDKRFKFSFNKLYAWSLVDYERVVMLDADNLFLQKTDELFQCGQFCAVFINPCIFHTGLFVLQPSVAVFKDMVHQLEIGTENPDGADQGFIGSYFPDLLDRPMFHQPSNGTKLDGLYRLPLGYQMDASYFYLKLRWNIPCGPNSVVTFPSALWLKPWYWWSYPVLPLGLSWHKQRHQTLGYSTEIPMVIIQTVVYIGIIALTRLARPGFSKLCYRRSDKNISLVQAGFKTIAMLSILAAYILPIIVIPCTLHPIPAWLLYFLGSFALLSIAVNAFLLPMLHVLGPWFLIIGTLLVMSFPWYPDGVFRALAVFVYAFCCAPVLWAWLSRIKEGIQVSVERDSFFPKLGESSSPPTFSKLC